MWDQIRIKYPGQYPAAQALQPRATEPARYVPRKYQIVGRAANGANEEHVGINPAAPSAASPPDVLHVLAFM